MGKMVDAEAQANPYVVYGTLAPVPMSTVNRNITRPVLSLNHSMVVVDVDISYVWYMPQPFPPDPRSMTVDTMPVVESMGVRRRRRGAAFSLMNRAEGSDEFLGKMVMAKGTLKEAVSADPSFEPAVPLPASVVLTVRTEDVWNMKVRILFEPMSATGASLALTW